LTKTSGHSRAGPSRKDVSVQLERLLASGDFDASPRSRAFVRYIVEETLSGRAEALSQAAIATTVFGRRGDFDPTVDPIVRIQAGRLRRSLERYYLLSGTHDPVRIELPRGTYVPAVSWMASPPGPAGEDRTTTAGSGDGFPTVVVRAFDSDSPAGKADAQQLDEQLSIEMGRYGDVRVVREGDLERLGRSAGGACDFEVSGRVSTGESGRRITARLLDRRSATQAWAEEYQSEPEAPAGFCAETARVVAGRVASEQGAIARRLWAEQRHLAFASVSPYGAVLRSYQFFFDRDPADFGPTLEALRRVVRERPECGLAWVQLARLLNANYGFEFARPASSIDEALECAQHGVSLDLDSQRARAALAAAYLLKGELAAGRAEAEKAYQLSPDSFVYQEWIGWLLALLGDWDRGTALIRRAMDRNPSHIPVAALHALWADHFRKAEFEPAYQAALQLRDPVFFWRALMRASCLGQLGRVKEAKREAAELLRLRPDFRARGRALIGRYLHAPGLADSVLEGLAKAGVAVEDSRGLRGLRRSHLRAADGAA
jgi:adenylate cyclase